MAELDPEQAREQAQQILDGDRYRSRDVPRPLEGVLRWIGERIQDLGEPVARILSTPEGVIVSLLVVGGSTALLVAAAIRRRSRLAVEAHSRRERARSVDPRELDREAEAAERAGDLAAAVRLRFRAGVLRLATVGVATARPGATTGRLLATVPSATFGPLARTFDAVAYGGREATPDDVAAARRDWPTVLAEVEAATAMSAGGSVLAGAGT